MDAGIAGCCVVDHEYECKSNQVTMTGTSACHVSRESSGENKTFFFKIDIDLRNVGCFLIL